LATPYRKPFVYILYDFRVIKLTRVGSFKKIATSAKVLIQVLL
jgi:hypothetical protein